MEYEFFWKIFEFVKEIRLRNQTEANTNQLSNPSWVVASYHLSYYKSWYLDKVNYFVINFSNFMVLS